MTKDSRDQLNVAPPIEPGLIEPGLGKHGIGMPDLVQPEQVQPEIIELDCQFEPAGP